MSDPADVRARWPDPMFLGDLAPILGTRSPSGARRIIVREGIPHGFLSRRMFVRRAALAAWFEGREAPAPPRCAPPPVPPPPPWAVDLLSRRRRNGP